MHYGWGTIKLKTTTIAAPAGPKARCDRHSRPPAIFYDLMHNRAVWAVPCKPGEHRRSRTICNVRAGRVFMLKICAQFWAWKLFQKMRKTLYLSQTDCSKQRTLPRIIHPTGHCASTYDTRIVCFFVFPLADFSISVFLLLPKLHNLGGLGVQRKTQPRGV